MKRITARGAVGALALAGVLAAASPGSAAHAAEGRPPNTATVVAAQAEPGVQLIATTFSATLTVPDAVADDSAFDALSSRVAADVASGRISSDKTSIANAIATAIDASPLTYLKPGSDLRTKDAQAGFTGTGWVVTPDGYLVTAAHVVAPDDAELKDAFAQDALDAFNKADADQIASDTDGSFSNDQLAKLVEASAKFNAHYLSIHNLTREVSAQLGVAVGGLGRTTKGTVANVVDVGEAFPGKDVAILKIDGQSNLPTLPVGTDADVTQGDTLYISGFPGASTFHAGLSADSEVQPTVVEGPLSAKKTSKAGVPVFQTQAPTSGGNSGGPVLDSAAKSIGILVAGVAENGVPVAGQEFVIPISVVAEKLNAHNIHPTQSLTTKTYNQGLADYFAHNYKAALKSFQTAQALYPGHPFAARYIADSETLIAQGKDRTPKASTSDTVSGIVMLLALGLGLFKIGRKWRSRKSSAGSPAPLSAPAFGFPPPPAPRNATPVAPLSDVSAHAPACASNGFDTGAGRTERVHELQLVGAAAAVAPAASLPTPVQPAAWYNDPQDHDGLRYWDGAHWTNHTAS